MLLALRSTLAITRAVIKTMLSAAYGARRSTYGKDHHLRYPSVHVQLHARSRVGLTISALIDWPCALSRYVDLEGVPQG